jgi:proteasome accessory factor B
VDRLERLADLTAVLLETRRPLTIGEILDSIPGYPESRDSARRQFERDKETLREAGIPVTVVPLDDLGGAELGYRVRPDEYYLPDLDLTPAEQAALHVAVTAVQFEGGKALEGLFKLGGLEGAASSPLAVLPNLAALHDLFEAYQMRATVEFTYRGEQRHLDVWGIVFRRGRWYVVGLDRDRAEPRSFRVDRIDEPLHIGVPNTVSPPDDIDPAALVGDRPWTFGGDDLVVARVALDASVADAAAAASIVETRSDGTVVVEMEVTNREAFRSLILGFLERAEVLEPPELREDIVAWLKELAGEST